MPDYLRYRVPGGTYFFTITLLERGGDLLVRHIDVLREAVRRTRAERPFHIDAWVVMPDHIHCVLTLPPGDADFSNRIKAIKIRFSRGVPRTESRSEVRAAKGERGIWQRRFWEHAVRDERDYSHCMDYVHFNPVKHGLVASVADWPHSTFHRCVAESCIHATWGVRRRAELLRRFRLQIWLRPLGGFLCFCTYTTGHLFAWVMPPPSGWRNLQGVPPYVRQLWPTGPP